MTGNAVAEMRKLDVNQPQSVRYCINLWQRDLQIQANNSRVKARIEARQEKRIEPIAVVCFGPSLNDTWEQIRGFKHVLTCSGAHKFLIDRGVIPTMHCDVDPRAHKVLLMGPPHPEVEYLIASACSPKLIDHLEAGLPPEVFQKNVKLWHVFDSKGDAIRTLPHGEWAILGGCSAGLRAMTIARFLGFTQQHVFGMDGAAATSGLHAAAHPNQAKEQFTCDYEGKTYYTNPAFLEAARQTFHELDQMPDVVPHFYGEGLVQEMAKRYVPKPRGKGKPVIGFSKPELISAEYRELNARLHRENMAYGVGAQRHVQSVLKLAEALKTKSILDYGAGKCLLGKEIPWQIAEYDPAVPGKEESPKPADIVCCFQVLEHVEPDKILYVLDDLKRCVLKVGYFIIDTGPARKTYANGQNTHLIQKDKDWWTKRLKKFFTVGSVMELPIGPPPTNGGPDKRFMELHIVVGPKQGNKVSKHSLQTSGVTMQVAG